MGICFLKKIYLSLQNNYRDMENTVNIKEDLKPQINEISLVVAIDEKTRGIGFKNKLLYHIKEDMEMFKKLTMGKVVVMGRKTYDSLPERFKPLPNRINVVLSHTKDFKIEGVETFSSIQEVIEWCISNNHRDIVFIGGSQIYNYIIENNLVSTAYVTYVINNGDPKDVDSYFPELPPQRGWKEVETASPPIDVGNNLKVIFKTFIRK